MKKQAQNAELIVMGNQGADLDSISSALVFAWYLAGRQATKIPVALIAVPRHKLRLRPEAAFVFAAAGINPENLLFVDDVDLQALVAAGTEIVLVDHNQLAEDFTNLEHRVTAVIDHHHDGGGFAHAAPRIIEKVGSTATLVAELVLKEDSAMDSAAARLLLSAILLDTANLDGKSGRCTKRDQEAALQLLAICGEEQDSFYQHLNLAQYDLKGLSSQELLGRDYKQWSCPVGRYGMSTVLLSLADWQQREAELVKAIAQFALKKELSVLIVMLASQSPDFQREVILFCREKGLHDKLAAHLGKQELDLCSITEGQEVGGERGLVSLYSQGNVLMSRKKLQPIVHCFLAGCKIPHHSLH
ncbi:MAG: DHHA2 domain-containing protein [Thermodesulfobacteriota bacterium]